MRAGIRLIEEDPAALKRFGHVALAPNPSRQALAAISLLEFSGVRETLELTASIVDPSGSPAPEMVDRLFQALTSDSVQPGVLPVQTNLRESFAAVDDLADRDRLTRQRERAVHDDAFVSSRRAAVEHSYEIQRLQVEKRLETASDARIIRMYHGRLRNLKVQRDELLAGLAERSTSTTRKLLCILAVDY